MGRTRTFVQRSRKARHRWRSGSGLNHFAIRVTWCLEGGHCLDRFLWGRTHNRRGRLDGGWPHGPEGLVRVADRGQGRMVGGCPTHPDHRMVHRGGRFWGGRWGRLDGPTPARKSATVRGRGSARPRPDAEVGAVVWRNGSPFRRPVDQRRSSDCLGHMSMREADGPHPHQGS